MLFQVYQVERTVIEVKMIGMNETQGAEGPV